MTRRFLSVLLAAVILLGLLPAATISVSAASTMCVSDEAITVLKGWEGFSATAYYDNGQYTIGYGTGVNKEDYPNGITKEEAEELLQEYLTKFEDKVNSFADANGLTLNQNQFDALVLFSFNVGTAWMSAGNDIRDAVVNGKTGNEFIFYLTRWCLSGDSISTGLIQRRLAEADIYLNGYYATKAPENFSYVIFDGNGGTYTYNIQGYDATEPVDVKGVANLSGNTFLGWYTAKEGGKWVEVLDNTTKALTLYAHWQAVESDEDEEAEETTIAGIPASYQRRVKQAVSVYETPSTTEETIATVTAGMTVSIVADHMDAYGVKWGELSDGGWIVLSGTEAVATAAAAPDRSNSVTATTPSRKENTDSAENTASSISVRVTASNLNYRQSAGTDGKAVGTLSAGTNVDITQVMDVDGTLWGKCSYGWICLTYTNYSEVIQQTGDGTTAIAVGTVTSNGNLCIRSGAGTNYTVVGTLTSGTKVEITQITCNKDVYWGRIASGWICLTYVDYTMVDSGSEDDQQEPSTTPDPDEDGDTPSSTVTGQVTASSLIVRKGPGTSYEVVTTLSKGTAVTITEQVLQGNVYWGKIENGWVCMTYIQVDTTGSDTEEDGTGDTTATTVVGVITASNLCVRKGAGSDYAILSTLPKGTEVTILQQTLVNGTLWGQIETGWICMSYVNITSGGSNLNYTGFVTATNLIIRTGAGTSYTATGTYPRGELIDICEMKQVNGTYWARTPDGWVCMTYVQLIPKTETDTTPDTDTDPEPDTGADTDPEPDENTTETTGVVTASNLCVRSGAGTNYNVVTTIPKGTEVVIQQQTVVNGTIWGQIENGWICMTYVKITSQSDNIRYVGMITASILNIRSGPGVGYSSVGTYSKGDLVDILEVVDVGTAQWGRTDKGWICMSYIQYTSITPDEDTSDKGESGSEEDSGNTGDNGEDDEELATFGFTCQAFVDAMNAVMEEENAHCNPVTSDVENALCYEFVTDSYASWGVIMYVYLGSDGESVAGIVMKCNVADDMQCENLIVFSVYAMMVVDETITVEDIDAMANNSGMDDDGNIYLMMERESGYFDYVIGNISFLFRILP